MKAKTIVKIVAWLMAIILFLAGLFFTIGYFYYGKILKTYLTETVSRESKGLYKADIGSLNLDLVLGNLTISNFSLIPDTAFYRTKAATDTLAPLLIKLYIKEFRIRNFKVMDAVKNRIIDVRRIRFIKPEITIFRMKIPPKNNQEKQKDKMMSIPLPKGLNSIEIKEFLVENARLEFIDCSQDSVTRNLFPTCNITIDHILVDSVHQGKRRLFNADDISVNLGAYELTLPNGMNKVSFGEIGLSTRRQEVYLKEFHLEPLYSKHDYTRKLGYQTDWMDIRIGQLKFERMDLRSLLFEGKLHAGLLRIDSLLLDDYRDKCIAPRPGFKPPMPQDGIRKLKTYLRIDTVLLNGGKAMYAEQVNAAPGTIFFDRMNATFTGLTNDSALLGGGLVSKLQGTAYLMGKGKANITVRFNLGDPHNAFNFSAVIGAMDLTAINPMLSNLLPAKVVSGQIKKLEIPMVYANDDVAKGHLLFYYNNLVVEVVDKKHTTWTKIKTGVINFAANDLVVNNDNPTKSGKMKTGVIFFERDKHKGIINFLWKSTLSGLKSTMGFNSKAQKAMIQDEKQTAHDKKQAEAKEQSVKKNEKDKDKHNKNTRKK